MKQVAVTTVTVSATASYREHEGGECNAIKRDVIKYDAIKCNAIKRDVIKCNAIKRDAIKCNAIIGNPIAYYGDAAGAGFIVTG